MEDKKEEIKKEEKIEKKEDNSSLGYQILKKEHEDLKKEFDAYKKQTEAQIKDIKNVVLANMKVNGQSSTKAEDEEKKRKDELLDKFIKSLK